MHRLATLFVLAAAAVPAIAQPANLNDRIIEEGLQNSQVMEFQDYLCNHLGHRLTGSDGFTRACEWARDEFAAMGLDARLEKWAEWKHVWNRGQWTGRVVAPEGMELQVATPAWTAGTRGLARGQLVRMPTTAEEVAELAPRLGEIYLWGARGRPDKAVRRALQAAVDEAGLLGYVQSAESTGWADRSYENQIRVFGNSNTARGSWEKLPTVPDIVVRDDQSERIDAMLEAEQEVVVEFDLRNRFRRGPIELHNVVADLVGTEHPDEVVIVCGHLDSWHQAAGATDNGTGVTSTLEAARILTAAGVRPRRTIRFMLWGGEEQGLLGSAAYVRQNRADMNKVSAVFNHDTGTNWAHSLTVTKAMHADFKRVLEPVMDLTPPDPEHDGRTFRLRWAEKMSGGFGGSDHASFMAAGVPAWAWGLTGRSKYGYGWHSQWDTYDIVIPEYQRHTATVIALTALGVANLPHMLPREGIERRSGGRGFEGLFRQWYGLELDEDLAVTGVVDGGRAARAGVAKGDVLIKLWGDEVEGYVDMYRAWRSHQEDDAIEFAVRRGDAVMNLRVDLEEPPEAAAPDAGKPSSQPAKPRRVIAAVAPAAWYSPSRDSASRLVVRAATA
ncbi:MAG: M20/M25/M40 family metallo-hydrolase [Planctomycetota bacterium]